MEAQEEIKSEFMLAIFKSKYTKKEIAAKLGISTGYLNNMLTGSYNLTDEVKSGLNKILKTKF